MEGFGNGPFCKPPPLHYLDANYECANRRMFDAKAELGKLDITLSFNFYEKKEMLIASFYFDNLLI